jgi:poly-gamma-glutamate synthesis protein (capsule biosynthesis protein)
VTESDLEALKEIGYGLRPPRSGRTPPDQEIYNFLGLGKFKTGPEREVIVEADERDIKRVTDAVKDAQQGSHLVMVTVHAHRQGAFLERFARACIDAGADCFFGDGPHMLKGLEIYKGKPIFYSLGNFLFEYETVTAVPTEIYEAWGEERGNKLDNLKSTPNDFYNIVRKMGNFQDEVYWTSVVAQIVFSDSKLKMIKLYPITLNYGADRADPLGRPMVAEEETSKKIIERMIDLSSPYGTKITYEEGIGIVHLKE